MEKEANFKDLVQEAIKRNLIVLVHTDKNGEKHKVSEMSDSYLLNCIKYAIKRKEEEAFWDAFLNNNQIFIAMKNNYPKDPVEEGKPSLDLEDDGYYADSEDFAIDDLYPEDDPEMDYYDSLDDDLDPNPHWDMPFDDDEDDLDNYD